MSELFAKSKPAKAGTCYEIFYGDRNGESKSLGTVGTVLGSNNRITGTWCYETTEGKMNWRAGRSMREAAHKLAKKCGIQLAVQS